ncbi:MAG: GTPase HflX [Methanomassiliicoccus sp.]|nr:MAG: GTPase HflX [Methanomassiliicoccus sp.]
MLHGSPQMRAVILSITTDLSELYSLLHTLKYEIVKEFVQKRDIPHSASYFGPGKIDEIVEEIKGIEPDVIVINGHLKPSQHHVLEMRFQKECIDRVGVILRIFSEHAQTPEAIAQVQLARLRYEQPFLREWVNKAKSGERPGFLSGGGYATDVYYEHARTHIKRLEKKLIDISQGREVKRLRRHEQGYLLVSLAGYTNAGKSALMNALCSSDVEVSSELFSSLSTTTRRIPGMKENVLMIDTVGFIRDLPPDLINAFKSTLEEIFYSDLVLFVFDSSDDSDILEMKMRTAFDILLPKVGDTPIVAVGSKMDKISSEKIENSRKIIQGIIGTRQLMFVSSFTKDGLNLIRERIHEMQGRNHVIEASLPIVDESYSLISRLHPLSDVISDIWEDHIRLSVRCNIDDSEKIIGWLRASNGTILIQPPPL